MKDTFKYNGITYNKPKNPSKRIKTLMAWSDQEELLEKVKDNVSMSRVLDLIIRYVEDASRGGADAVKSAANDIDIFNIKLFSLIKKIAKSGINKSIKAKQDYSTLVDDCKDCLKINESALNQKRKDLYDQIVARIKPKYLYRKKSISPRSLFKKKYSDFSSLEDFRNKVNAYPYATCTGKSGIPGLGYRTEESIVDIIDKYEYLL
tara:strand:- start:55 stop:672 length:618 start_codon:yes stop_codon:yes gene_type:complete